MTLTAPGCGMGPMLAQDVQNKLLSSKAWMSERGTGLGSAVEPGHADRSGQAATGIDVKCLNEPKAKAKLSRIRMR